ncbi:hypothetical protein [Paraferrimonas sp. SM1919]|uniref:hypothetical protein n=1 Tax=Paraferrimonas sp. SM1919 TaxID=2662263 RepID=UPI0013D166F5|nr:hypothetical protein [Paraferrimonas sp. SM1919]
MIKVIISLIFYCFFSTFLSAAPCWINDLKTMDYHGAIGTYRDLDIGFSSPISKARERAVKSLLKLEKLPIEQIKTNKLQSVESIDINGSTIYFANELVDSGYIYSFAYFADKKVDFNTKCEIQSCKFEQCQPSWLCHSQGVIGASYSTSTPDKQIIKAQQNAFKIANLINGIEVDSYQTLKRSATPKATYHLSQHASVEALAPTQNSHYQLLNQCKYNNTLLVNISVKELGYKLPETIIDPKWLTNPKYSNMDGAVGSSILPTADGLISSQINLAIKRAAVQLAKEKKIYIRSESVIVNVNGRIKLEDIITETTKTNLNIKLNGLIFKPLDNNFIGVHAWVVNIQE